jgi:surface carbohydrate biosynthesis protein
MNTSPEPVGPYLYLPIEIASRELDSRVLLALLAMRFGMEVILGRKRLLHRNLRYMPRGVVLFKTLTERDAEAMRDAKAVGHGVVALDEEVPGMVATQEGLKWVMPSAVTASDIILAVGDDHEAALRRKFPSDQQKFVVVGNPRWDLLRPELRGYYRAQAEEIRARHGRFLLINTNFGGLNNVKGSPDRMLERLQASGRIDMTKASDVEFITASRRLQAANLAAFKELVRAIPDRFPEHRLIVRPHPNERLDTWEEWTRGLPRVSVVRDGAAAAWILASDGLIHAHCTTGVEAFTLDKPAVSLQAADEFVSANYVANQVNYLARTVSEVLEIVQAWMSLPPGEFQYPARFHEIFSRFVTGNEGAFAAMRILEAIRTKFVIDSSPEPLGVPSWQPLSGYAPWTPPKAFHKQIFPPMTAEQLRGVFEEFQALLGDKSRIAVTACGDRLFHVHAGDGRTSAGDVRRPRAPLLLKVWQMLHQPEGVRRI